MSKSSFYSLDAGSSGTVPLPINLGGTGSTTAAAARDALGLEIGADVQAYSAVLAAIAGLGASADTVPYFTGASTMALTTLSAFGRTLIDDASASAALTTLGVSAFAKTFLDDADAATVHSTLGLVIGTNVQAFHANLAAIAGLSVVADSLIYGTGVGTLGVGTITAAGRALVDDADDAAQRVTLGLVIGTNVQAFHANLSALAGLSLVADRLAYANGTGTLALATFTAAGRALVDDADAAAQRTTLGLGSIATQNSNNVTITGGSITSITDLAVADGGTGQSTAAAGFDALAPTTTQGDIIFRDATTNTRLAIGTSNRVLTSTGTAPSWSPISTVIDNGVGGTRGMVPYRGSGGWTGLSPGTTGLPLKSNGAGADPSYGTIGGTAIRFGSDAQGDVAYFNGSDWARLAAGTSGQFLKTNGAGANPAWASASGSLIALDRKTSSSVASYDFVTGIDGTYRTYKLIGWLQPATDDVELWLRVSLDAGSNWRSTAADYKRAGRANNDGGTNLASTSTSMTELKLATTDGSAAVGNNTMEYIMFEITVHHPSSTAKNKMISAQVDWLNPSTGSAGGQVHGQFAGSTSAVNGLRLMFESGNIAAGDVTLYALANS